MKTLDGISKDVGPHRARFIGPMHYIAGVCSALYLREALDWRPRTAAPPAENVAKGFYQTKDWVPAGMEGRLQSFDLDREGSSLHDEVDLYRSKISGSTTATSTT